MTLKYSGPFWNAYIIKVLETSMDDLELQNILEQTRKPIYYHDNLLGKFKLDKHSDFYVKKVSWADDKGEVFVYNTSSEELVEAFKYLQKLLEPIYLQKVKVFASNEISLITEEWTGKYLTIMMFK